MLYESVHSKLVAVSNLYKLNYSFESQLSLIVIIMNLK